MISHKNIIANTMQLTTFESNYKNSKLDSSLGVLPMSHSYALIVTGHASVYRGYNLVVMPGFDLVDVLEAVQKYRIDTLWMVPPMIVALIKATSVTSRYDLTHVKTTVVGASNLTKEVNEQFSRLFPNCQLIQGYGLTEAAVVVSMQNREDMMFGSCGHLFPGYEARLVSRDGEEVTTVDTPGELLVRSPTLMLGYMDNEVASKDAFTDDGWLRTGDLMEFRRSEKGHEHLFIVDRVKELIKVRVSSSSPVMNHFLSPTVLNVITANILLKSHRACKSPQLNSKKSSAGTLASPTSPWYPSPTTQQASYPLPSSCDRPRAKKKRTSGHSRTRSTTLSIASCPIIRG